jgi:hypothetical protein
MLRRTLPLAIAPLPLYKVAIVIGRQFSRPIVDYFLQGASNSPMLRKGFITIGWNYYRASVHLERLIWGAEQQEKKVAQEAQIKEALREEISTATAATTTATLKPEVKNTILNETTTTTKGEFPANVDEMPLTASTQIPTNPLETVSPTSLKLSSPKIAKPTAGSGVYQKVIHNPLKKVRNIFTPPPRPSDEELLKKGMKLCVEVGLIIFVCLMVGYEMYQTSKDKKEKEKLLELRFQRLEKHVVHFQGCGCAPGVKDGEVPPSEEIEGKKLLQQQNESSSVEKTVDGIIHKFSGTSAEKGGVQEGNTNNTNNKTSTANTTTTATTTNQDAEKKKNDSTVAAAVSNNTTTAVAAIKPTKGGEIARLPKSVDDLCSLWLHLPWEVQCTIAAVFFLPYTFMALLVLRLFSLVHQQQKRMQTA